MRLNEIDGRNDLIEFVHNNCQPFLKMIDDKPLDYRLYRGMFQPDPSSGWGIKDVRQNRWARDIPSATQEQLINAFNNTGLKANRNNSVFCTGRKMDAEYYGRDVFNIIPVGEFEFSWSSKIVDLFTYLDGYELFGQTDEYFNKLIAENYIDNNLKMAISSQHEIMIACAQYVYIKRDFFVESFGEY